MSEHPKKSFSNPTKVLQEAIRELESFTLSGASRLEVDKDGHLIAAKETNLERVMGLARAYIVPIFSDQFRQQQQQKLKELKKAVLKARDIVQSHSALIEKFKYGDVSQQKLATYALEAIQRYNSIVTQDALVDDAKFEVYNFERDRLLHDEEIKGLQIELPHTFSVKYESHPSCPAQERLKELSAALVVGAVRKKCTTIQPTHKKTDQFMVDTFRMKAIRMIETHLSEQNSMSEVLALIKQTEIEVEDSHSASIVMRQLLEVGPGSFILLTGCFNRPSVDSNFMRMPMLESFKLSSQLTHSGFPYPSQYTGWALADKWVEAYPLRIDQLPLFQSIDHQRKQLAHRHLYDQAFIQQTRRKSKLKKEVFDQNREIFLPLHRKLQEEIIQESHYEDFGYKSVLDAFYDEANQAISAFDMLVKAQQQILDLFIKHPLKTLEEEWLEGDATLLRLGSSQERYQAANLRLEQERVKIKASLNSENVRQAFIFQQGSIMGKAFQAVGLQYQSEKMGFAPPLLSDFERKLQICAFQQLISFSDECEHRLGSLDQDNIKEELLKMYSQDLHLLQSGTSEEGDGLSVAVADELEVYFNSRYWAIYPRRLENIS